MNGFIIKLDSRVWLSDWEGDPGRTRIRSNAKIFNTRRLAECCLRKAKKDFAFRDFSNAEIEEK